jgi:hypothetical protein
MNVFRRQQRLVLAHEAGIGRREDLLEVVDRQRFELDRIGKRPCSSGIRSDGFEKWKAAEAMNRM